MMILGLFNLDPDINTVLLAGVIWWLYRLQVKFTLHAHGVDEK